MSHIKSQKEVDLTKHEKGCQTSEQHFQADLSSPQDSQERVYNIQNEMDFDFSNCSPNLPSKSDTDDPTGFTSMIIEEEPRSFSFFQTSHIQDLKSPSLEKKRTASFGGDELHYKASG